MATIRKRGNRWQVQVRRKDQAPVSKSFIQKADAQAWARKMESAADRGELAVLDIGCITTRTILERYRDEVSPRKKGGDVEVYRINVLLRAHFVDTDLKALSSSLLSRYRDERLNVVSGSSVRRELGLLGRCYEVARKVWGWPVNNPLRDIAKPDDGKPRDRRLEDGEQVRPLATCAQCRNDWIAPAVRLALTTGMRRGEILKARWEHLDLDKRTLHIPETKNGHSRTIPLSPDALRLLERLLQLVSKPVVFSPHPGARPEERFIVKVSGLMQSLTATQKRV